MISPLGAALLLTVLALGGYLAGSWRARARERELAARLADCGEQLQAARAELARLNTLDGLTQIATRDEFQKFLEREWRQALRELTPLSLILVDIDHFTHYNERLGREAGDQCLRRVAGALRDTVGRPGDLVARDNGAQFIVGLARTHAEGVVALATRLRAAVEALELPHPGCPVADHVTVSIGVATAVPSRGSPWQEIELVAATERALADAKSAGRNRVARAEFIAGRA